MDFLMDSKQSMEERILRKIIGLTDREVAVVLKVLSQYDNGITVIREKSYLHTRLNHIRLDLDCLLVLLNDVKAVLMPEENIDWITKDLRASLWFDNYYKKCIPNPPLSSSSLSNHVDSLITSIDCSFMSLNPPIYSNDSEQIPLINYYNFCLEHKLTIINNTKMLYHSIFTERKYTDWIDISDQDQLYWAADYLKKAARLVEVPLFLAQNNEDMFAQICASLDAIDNLHNMSYQYTPTVNKKYFISNMRKAWSQKKFRDKKDVEAAQDLLLNRKAKKQLLELSSAYGISSVEMLTNLIDAAYQDITVE
jgi:hypothetical protein